ncbi:MAG: 3-hydroxyacyl-(acyl-carrier-protein) dehydratase FabZ [Syntrophus sp. PtaU1.Bin208]|nr:MAG: 3-hydroxyacyl-(acyl-carrier-protein) dehydratase FabZ [Syntrophus sp. PtaU1.Bin208]
METWDFPADMTFQPPNGVILQARAPQNSPWFDGHFPGQPILPGIALISLVKKGIRFFGEKQKRKFQHFGIRKARFTLPIRPGDAFEISLLCRVSEGKLVASFKIYLEREMAGNGIVEASFESES